MNKMVWLYAFQCELLYILSKHTEHLSCNVRVPNKVTQVLQSTFIHTVLYACCYSLWTNLKEGALLNQCKEY